MLPLRTSVIPKRTPYANYLLIAVNTVVFLLSTYLALDPRTGKHLMALRPWAGPFMLHPEHPYIWQFVTYAFLHGSVMHIVGNMFFLYIFGNNVNDKLGNIGYLCFYLASAVFSGIGHSLLSYNSVLGASGAVAAVTGAYLVLLPNSLITVVYWFFFIGTVEIRALYFIALKLIFWDNILAADPRQGIAYSAHLAGYAFGIAAVLGLLSLGLIETNYNDLWSMLRQWNRRRQFRDTSGDSSFDKPVRTSVFSRTPIDGEQNSQIRERILELRSRISDAMNSRLAPEAAALYLELLKIDDAQILPRQLQLDVANQLMSEGQWQLSADAYQKYLSQYSHFGYAEQVHLMLGLLYGRYLNRFPEALKHLNMAKDHLTDPGQKNLCLQEIERLNHLV
ncbi:MAG TPA: rhomboid family intramembrane serine protease [Anaerohalosphaeraceae bacterium]|nr:rhomboid family intramembrane serine protease [Phycisphaerae bacterium]HOK96751.1 rhomboid family intramembrane serine protease [Anaerohalosphaeraceae bacterium]HOL31574.1 rhomboid family intramembrane serine protease [Anaerohalosphaeraceae bacterium]HOM76990.1 rhomboid family intramembrane serine protease [Anaerohalosphaeraceae bacterium]HPC63758.1 rhomboid family intramembrane serine protease [Anaerohalosphaeraceae bacterium]